MDMLDLLANYENGIVNQLTFPLIADNDSDSPLALLSPGAPTDLKRHASITTY